MQHCCGRKKGHQFRWKEVNSLKDPPSLKQKHMSTFVSIWNSVKKQSDDQKHPLQKLAKFLYCELLDHQPKWSLFFHKCKFAEQQQNVKDESTTSNLQVTFSNMNENSSSSELAAKKSRYKSNVPNTEGAMKIIPAAYRTPCLTSHALVSVMFLDEVVNELEHNNMDNVFSLLEEHRLLHEKIIGLDKIHNREFFHAIDSAILHILGKKFYNSRARKSATTFFQFLYVGLAKDLKNERKKSYNLSANMSQLSMI